MNDKKTYLCTLMIFFMNMLCAQNINKCSDYVSDDKYFRYTSVGYQTVIDGNHSKAINESRKMANIYAESELAKMVNAAVSHVMQQMTVETDSYSDIYADTLLVSTYRVFKGMKTICQSETKLVDDMYVTYVTKEISLDNVSDMFRFADDKDRKRFRSLLAK